MLIVTKNIFPIELRLVIDTIRFLPQTGVINQKLPTATTEWTYFTAIQTRDWNVCWWMRCNGSAAIVSLAWNQDASLADE